MGIAVKAAWIEPAIAPPLNGSRERTAQEIVRELEKLMARAESVGLDLGAHLIETAAQHLRLHAGADEDSPTSGMPPAELV